MNTRKFTLLALSALVLSGNLACRHTQKRRDCCPPAGGNIVLGQPGNLPPQGLPPGAVAQPPPGATVVPGGTFQGLPPGGGAQPPPPAPVPSDSGFRQPEVLYPSGTPGGVSRPAVPPGAVSAAGPSVRLLEPESDAIVQNDRPEPHTAFAPPAAAAPGSAAPADDFAAGFPVGIPEFAVVKGAVATGRKPDPDGLDWLKGRGYRALVYLHLPGDDTSALRRDAESRGLTFEAVALGPDRFDAPAVVRLNRLVAAASPGAGVFVADASGPLAGAAWYVHLRQVEGLGDDEARVRAGRLGLREQGDAEQAKLWVAARRYLAG